ncbi:hypothetical protein JC525_18430 [Alteromonas sp. IB21]|uniref:rhamnan synthesis F family protein n=1 Tax=Alteromonas sp. IB21 TaxID=2779369 RepID=UPI0018E8D567|nr:rhamnan synthesis F family protein [Alteromonas sp. IB21]MBJ2130908.1 hypothetical protein [Alteromonas sp. IB21]
MQSELPFLFISGFHRSGTSLVAQTLYSNGVNMGHQLMGASFDNQNGHFEDLPLVELHDKILGSQGLDWQTTFDKAIEPPAFLSRRLKDYAEHRESLRESFFGAKDPRALYFLNAWEEAFEGNILFLLVFRGWKYSVSSLLKRHSRKLLNTTAEVTTRPEDFLFWQTPDLAAKMWAASAKLILSQYEKAPEKTLLIPLEDLLVRSDTFMQRVSEKGLPLTLFDTEKSFSEGLLQKQIPASAMNMISPDVYNQCEALESQLYEAFGSSKSRQTITLSKQIDLAKQFLASQENISAAIALQPTAPIKLEGFTVDEAIELINQLPTTSLPYVKWEQLIDRGELNNSDLQAIFELAMRKRQLNIAEIAMQRAINNHPAPWRWMNLGDVYLQKRLFGTARKCYVKAKELDPTNSTFIARLADVETLQGNVEEAQNLINKAIELDDTKPAIKSAIKRLEEAANKSDKSQGDDNRFLQIISDYQRVVELMSSNKQAGLALDEYVVKSAFVTKNIKAWLSSALSQLNRLPGECLLDYLLAHFSRYWSDVVIETELLGDVPVDDNQVAHLTNVKCSDSASIGVHIHVFYPSLLPEILSFLANINRPIKLVCTCTLENKTYVEQILPGGAIIKACENKGRDIAPWLIHAAPALSDCDIVLKLHTKSSNHDSALYGWRLQLLWCLLGTNNVVNEVIERFNSTSELAILTAPYHPVLKHDINWGKNKDIATALANRLGISLPDVINDFPAGSMFWYKPSQLSAITEHEWCIDDFPAEEGQIDGTVMHAIERVLGAFNLQQPAHHLLNKAAFF